MGKSCASQSGRKAGIVLHTVARMPEGCWPWEISMPGEILFVRFMAIDSAFRMEETVAEKGFISGTGRRKKEQMESTSGSRKTLSLPGYNKKKTNRYFTNNQQFQIMNRFKKNKLIQSLQLIPGLVLIAFCISSCNHSQSADQASEYKTTLEFGPGQENKILEAFLTLKDSSEIHLKEGLYSFEN